MSRINDCISGADDNFIAFIEKELSKRVTAKNLNILFVLLDGVRQVWTYDTVVKHYTSHRLDHTLRVVFYAIKILQTFKIKLDETGTFLLFAGCILHDIGLQCKNEAILNKYFTVKDIKHENLIGDYVRKFHVKISADWFEFLYQSNKPDNVILSNVVKKIPPDIAPHLKTCMASHSGNDIFENKNSESYTCLQVSYNTINIAVLIRLADELDIDRGRIDLSNPITNDLPLENSVYFWLHYFTIVTFNQNRTIDLKIELNENDEEKEAVFKKEIYDKFIDKNTKLFDLFLDLFHAPISVNYQFGSNSFIQSVPATVFDLIFANQLDSFDAISYPEYTYKIENILEVFKLDKRLLPNLYGEDQHALTEVEALKINSKNPFCTFGAYKNGNLIGYLTCYPVTKKKLLELLNFEILESELHFEDILCYEDFDQDICWYISGLGVIFEERCSVNYPTILAGLINKSYELIRDILQPKRIKIQLIGAISYTPTAEKLCLKKSTFGSEIPYKEADFLIEGFRPKSFLTDLNCKRNKRSYLQKIHELYQ